jgi:ADP-ribose pyrophosphatase
MSRIVPQNAMLIPETAKRVFTGQIFDVYQWPQELFDGTTATYEMLKRPDTLQVIAVKDGKLVLLEEQQSGRPTYVRFPGGRVESDEDWQVAAERECREEIGMRFDSWRLIDVRQSTVKIEWFVATFLAIDFIGTEEPQPESGEHITDMDLSFDEVKQRLQLEDNPVIGYAQKIFEKFNSLDDLLAAPPFTGKVIKDYHK